MKKFLVIFLMLFFPVSTIAWSPLPIWSGWDGSTYWSTDMPIDAPSIPTNDQIISSWDNKIRLSDELRILFMQRKVIEMGCLYKNGILKESWGIYGKEERSFKIIEDIAMVIWNKFHEDLICVSYYPQFDAFSVILHPDKSQDVERHSAIAEYLESMRVDKYREFCGDR